MNLMAYDEDFWIERREPRVWASKQTPEQGAAVAPPDSVTSITEDVEYFQRKLFASLCIPKEYLGKAQ